MSRVTIILPLYNCEKYITTMMDCLKNQIFKDWNCLLIDDGSTDNTKEIVKPYLEDSRFHYFYKENGGPSTARNLALDLAFRDYPSDYIYFCDADDYIDHSLLNVCVKKLDETKLDIVEFGYKTLDPQGKVTYSNCVVREQFSRSAETLWCVWRCLIRSSLIRDNNIRFDERLKWGEDSLFMRTCAYFTKDNWHLDIPYYFYYYKCQNPDSLIVDSYKRNRKVKKLYIKCYEDFIKSHPWNPVLGEMINHVNWHKKNKKPQKPPQLNKS